MVALNKNSRKYQTIFYHINIIHEYFRSLPHVTSIVDTDGKDNALATYYVGMVDSSFGPLPINDDKNVYTIRTYSYLVSSTAPDH